MTSGPGSWTHIGGGQHQHQPSGLIVAYDRHHACWVIKGIPGPRFRTRNAAKAAVQ